jgi:hypothetical protein
MMPGRRETMGLADRDYMIERQEGRGAPRARAGRRRSPGGRRPRSWIAAVALLLVLLLVASFYILR